MRPHRQQPTRLPRPRDSPGKNTGVGCHFLLQCLKVKMKSLSCVRLFATPWTAAHQAPPFMGFSRQEYCSGVALPSLIYYPKFSLNTSVVSTDPNKNSWTSLTWSGLWICLPPHPWLQPPSASLHLRQRASFLCFEHVKLILTLVSLFWLFLLLAWSSPGSFTPFMFHLTRKPPLISSIITSPHCSMSFRVFLVLKLFIC